MVRSVEASRNRLKTDAFDLDGLLIGDKLTSLEEVMRAFDDLEAQGKILHASVSDMPAWSVARANTLAELRGGTPFGGLPIESSLTDRAARGARTAPDVRGAGPGRDGLAAAGQRRLDR